MNELADAGALVLLYSAMVPLGLFVGYYLAFSRWWTTAVGRAIVWLAASLFVVTAFSLSRRIFGDWHGLEVARFFVYLAMNIGLWHLFLALRSIQKATRPPRVKRERKDKP